MIRLSILLVGLLAVLIGAISYYRWYNLPVDIRSVECKIGSAIFSLDVVLIILGVFLILIALLFHRLSQE